MALGIKGLRSKSESTAPDAQQAAAPPPSVPQASAARPSRPARANRNRGWMIAGGALILMAGIAAASIASSLSQSVDVLVAARSIPEGAVINGSDYRTVSIAADTGAIQAIAPADAEKLIGQLASGPIGEGSILHPDQFTNRADQEIEGTVVIGADLRPNDIPVLDLLPGDRIRLFETFDAVAAGISTFGVDVEAVSSVAREITDAEVVTSTPLGLSGDQHVSIRINESNANIVANLIEQDRLTIVLVDSLPSPDPVGPGNPTEPLEPGEPGDS